MLPSPTVQDKHEDLEADENEGSSIQVTGKKWLILRTAEYAGWLKPLGPVLLHLDSLLAELRRIALWEDVYKASVVTGASMVLGIASSFVRIAKIRPTSWLAGTMGLSVLATAPWMASGGTLKGSWAYFAYSKFGIGQFPKVERLEQINELKPWLPSFRSAKSWKLVLKPQHPATS